MYHIYEPVLRDSHHIWSTSKLKAIYLLRCAVVSENNKQPTGTAPIRDISPLTSILRPPWKSCPIHCSVSETYDKYPQYVAEF